MKQILWPEYMAGENVLIKLIWTKYFMCDHMCILQSHYIQTTKSTTFSNILGHEGLHLLQAIFPLHLL